MNILEEEDFIKGLPDSVLMEEAQRPTGTLTQYVVMSEIQRRSKMRKEHEAQLAQGPQSTVKDQIIQEGIMSNMPPQMAMAPQMAQRMPNMPPQGIQQVMPPQMMSGGGVVKMSTGMQVPNLLAAPLLAGEPLQQRIDKLLNKVRAGELSYADVISKISSMDSASSDAAVAYARAVMEGEGAGMNPVGGMTLIEGDSSDDIRSKVPFGPPASQIYANSAVKQAFDAAKRGIFSQTPSQLMANADASTARGLIPGLTNIDAGFGPGMVSDGNNLGRTIFDNVAEFVTESEFDPRISKGDTTKVQVQNQLLGIGPTGPVTSVFGTKVDEKPVVASDPTLVPADASADDPVERAFRDQNPYGIERVDLDDATIPSGADAAAGRLAELQAMIDKQSAASSNAAKGAALIALGTSIMEGKTAQGGAKAGEILAKDAQTRGALQLEGAKLRLADARQGEKLQIMRDELANKLQITDRQSLMAALKSYGDSITALINDRTRLMTEEGQTLMTRLTQEQALLRSLLIPDVDLDKAGALAPVDTSQFSINRPG